MITNKNKSYRKSFHSSIRPLTTVAGARLPNPLTTGAQCPPWPVAAPRGPVQAPLITGRTGRPLRAENTAELTSDLGGDPQTAASWPFDLGPTLSCHSWVYKPEDGTVHPAEAQTAPRAPPESSQHRAPHRSPASSEWPIQPWPNRVAEE